MNDAIDYEFWSDFLFREGAVCSPSELHGVLCAVNCVRNEQWLDTALRVLDVPLDDLSPALQTAMEALNEIVAKTLKDDHYGLQLILPDDALPAKARSAALADWCHGFLHGFGSLGEVTAKRLDEDGAEALRDLAKITELDSHIEDDESNESDLYELQEYVRIVVISLYTQLNPSASGGVQLH